MSEPRQVSFDQYLEIVFATPAWLDGCTTMLAAFLEDIESCRDTPGQTLPSIAPGIITQVDGIARRVRRLEAEFRSTAEDRGPEYQTTELGAILWWAGMALHKVAGSLETIHLKAQHKAWNDVYFELHAALYDLIASLALLSVAQQTMARQDAELGLSGGRPN